MAHPDLDQLLNTLLPFVQQTLAKYGEFIPFGLSMKIDGTIIANAACNGREHSLSQEIIDLMADGFCQSATSGEIRAAGICYDVRIVPPGQTKKTDAICVSLEHQSGNAVDIFIPYKKGWFGKVNYGELFATKRTPQFFTTKS